MYKHVVFFKRLRPEHLHKDVGYIAGVFNEVDGPSCICGFEGGVKRDTGVKLFRGAFDSLANTFLLYLKLPFFCLGVKSLTLIHVTRENVLLACFCRLMNHKIKVYIKGDVNLDSFLVRDGFWVGGRFFYWLMAWAVDVVSVETKKSIAIVGQKIPRGVKIVWIPNVSKFDSNPEKQNKNKRLLYVGRFGCPHKNVEFLFEAIERAGLKKWKFDLVGPVEDHFKGNVNKFLETSAAKSCVFWHGEVKDKQRLKELYEEASFLILTSRSEGFPLVCVEALSMGCGLITTPIHAADELVCGNGFTVETVEGLIEVLKEIDDSALAGECFERSLSLYQELYSEVLVRRKLVEIIGWGEE